MIRPPADYQLTKVDLSSRTQKIGSFHFDSAIIFFVPKVADKGIDITTLICTIVQVIDRGEWGKEEVSFTVDASSLSNRKHRLFDLMADAPYDLKLIPPPELRLGILEIYFDPNYSQLPNIHLPNMGVTNPSSSDPAALQAAILATIPAMAQAIGQQSGAAVQIALANNNSSLEASISTTKASVIKAWSGDIRNHQILDVNLTRLAIHGTHPGKNLLATNTADVFLAVGSITGRDQNKWDHVLSAGGEFISDPDKERLPLYAWLAVGKPDTTITVTEYFPQPVTSA
jgi:hypothetical protein